VVLHAWILSLVISPSGAVVPLLCRKSVKRQRLWQKATISCLLCSAVSCGMLQHIVHPKTVIFYLLSQQVLIIFQKNSKRMRYLYIIFQNNPLLRRV